MGRSVHLNGRVYDPLIGKFISGDPHITDPLNGQNYNRYSYVLNNPTNDTDPTGLDAAVAVQSTTSMADVNKLLDDGSSHVSASDGNNTISFTKNSDGTITAVITTGSSNGGAPTSQPGAALQPKNGAASSGNGASWADNHLPRLSDFTSPGTTFGDIWTMGKNVLTTGGNFYDMAVGDFEDSDRAANAWDNLIHRDKDATIGTVMLAAGGLTGARALGPEADLNRAAVARDTLVDALAPLKGKAPNVVTVAYDTRTGKVAVGTGGCSTGKCGEDHAVDALGGDKSNVKFTRAIRPRDGREIPICERCEAKYGRDAFPKGTIFKSDQSSQ